MSQDNYRAYKPNEFTNGLANRIAELEHHAEHVVSALREEFRADMTSSSYENLTLEFVRDIDGDIDPALQVEDCFQQEYRSQIWFTYIEDDELEILDSIQLWYYFSGPSPQGSLYGATREKLEEIIKEWIGKYT